MYIEEHRTRKVFGSDSTMGLFVALYLILLAFFIVLTSVSQQSAQRASAAMDSVNTVFMEDGSTREGEGERAVVNAASDPVLIEIDRALSSVFNVRGQYAEYGGNIYQVQMPVAAFFEAGSFRVRSDTRPLLEELLTVLTDAPYGHRQELALLFGVGAGTVDREMTRSQEVAVRRAGSFARFMEDRGFKDFSTGFAAVPDDQVLLVFRNIPGSGNGTSRQGGAR